MTTKGTPMSADIAAIARGLTKAQRDAVMGGHIRDCPYGHPDHSRCPNCNEWPYAKGEAVTFAGVMRAHLMEKPQ